MAGSASAPVEGIKHPMPLAAPAIYSQYTIVIGDMDETLTLPALDFSQIGPQVGARFPDVVLPDQHGRRVSLHEERAGRRALVVFHRSALW
jgi:hypothetical protein